MVTNISIWVHQLAATNSVFCDTMLCRISCVGIYVASLVTGKGPYALLLEHVHDPIHNNAVQNLL